MQKYPKIAHKTTKGVNFTSFEPEHYIVIQEKLDGRNFRVMIDGDNNVGFGSRKVNDDQKLFDAPSYKKVIDHFNEIPKKIFGEVFQMLSEYYGYHLDKIMVFGEYLSKPKEHSIIYDRHPVNYLGVFDIMVMAEDRYSFLHPANAKYDAVCESFQIDQVPVLYFGKSGCGIQDFIKIAESFFETKSYLGGSKIEGTVAKNYERFISEDGAHLVEYRDDGRLGLPMIKFVQEEFKEHKHVDKDKIDINSIQGIASYISERTITQGRVNKAIFGLEETLGKGNIDRKQTGDIIKATMNDVLAEEDEEIRKLLYNAFKKKLGRYAEKIRIIFFELLEKKLLEG